MIEIYTDGACSGNPGIGSFAAVIVEDSEVTEQIVGWEEYTTNNHMELKAVLEATRYILENKAKNATIFSDSAYVVNGINKWMAIWNWNGWMGSNKKIIKNRELWREVFVNWKIMADQKYDVEIHHIYGHSGNEFNELADKLATKCIDDNKKK